MATVDFHPSSPGQWSTPWKCGSCAKFTATQVHRPWVGNIYNQFSETGGVGRRLYFSRFDFDTLNLGGSDSHAAWNFTTLVDVSAGLNYGATTTTTVNPDNLRVQFHRISNPAPFPWDLLANMAAPGEYLWGMDLPLPNGTTIIKLLSFTPGPKYVITLENLALIRADFFPLTIDRKVTRRWSFEHTETEFEDVLFTLLDGGASYVHVPFRYGDWIRTEDSFAYAPVSASAGGVIYNIGHAIRHIVNWDDLGNNGVGRGYGVLRRSAIHIPGMHKVNIYKASEGTEETVQSTFRGTQTASPAGYHTPGPVNPVTPIATPYFDYGAVYRVGCENLGVACDANGAIEPVRGINRMREWIQDRSCPP